MTDLTLPSGAVIPRAEELVAAFFAEEWAYYDGVEDADPDRIVPLDVIATLAVNSFINSAARIRAVHRGLAVPVDEHLPSISQHADLRTVSSDVVVELLHEACQVPYVLVPVATKVLHRKRPRLIPMLDNVVIGYYLDATGRRDLMAATQDKRRAAAAAGVVLEAFRKDLQSSWPQLAHFREGLAADGLPVTELRILEVLVWIWADPLRQYLKIIDLPDGDA